MSSPSSGIGKRRSLTHQPTNEDQELNMVAQEAESRLANSHAVLAEARKIRIHEREEQERLRQAEDDIDEEPIKNDGDDGQSAPVTESPTPSAPGAPTPAPPTASNTVAPKRVVTDDTFPNGVAYKSRLQSSASSSSTSVDMEEKYKRVMMTNAQLDNEKQVLQYEVELLKDKLADADERYIEMERLHANTCRELAEQMNAINEWQSKCKDLQDLLSQRDALIKEHGLLCVTVGEAESVPSSALPSSALLSLEAADLLSDYEGSLGEKLQKFFQDKVRLEEENKHLQRDLETERNKAALTTCDNASTSSILSVGSVELDAETIKNVTEYKLKLKRAEQEILTLQGSVTRLECQVNRYKSASETSEQAEEELKQEKRRLQKELREAQSTVQELETKNGHLMKRLEKFKGRNLAEAN